jgi:hypothetical protein
LYGSIYQRFDGFLDDDFDSASFLRIWNVEKVVMSPLLDEGFVPFADFSLHSEVYGLRPRSASTIFCYYSRRSVALAVSDFIEGLVNGKYDDTLGP